MASSRAKLERLSSVAISCWNAGTGTLKTMTANARLNRLYTLRAKLMTEVSPLLVLMVRSLSHA
ncbi:hypothetical protein D3C81_2168750 [compost metagenome]